MVVTQNVQNGDPAPGIIQMSGVYFAWPGERSFRISVESFALEKGSRTLLLGPSGSGKSTLLSLLCGIAPPDRGSIRLLGTDITALSSAARDRFRADHIGIIFQMFNLLPYGSAVDNVLLPLSFAKERRERVSAAGGQRQEAERLLCGLGIEGDLLTGSASRLSVGQQQRVAAARALIGAPEIIIADEPTSALDRGREDAFLKLLFEQVEAAASTLIMVSHDESLSPRFDQVLQLADIVKREETAA
ncbi:MAG: ABC transporter ATP-binding protein [Pseudomonadota bacterium]